MKTRHVTDRITQLTRMHFVNAFLVREEDGLTLVDTTMGGAADSLVAAADAAGAPIRRIALTHGHGDHVGSLDALAAALPAAEVIASEREAALLAGDTKLREHEPAGRMRGGFRAVATRPARLAGDGDQIGSLRVLATPGHTPGHLAFFDPRDGTLYAGDSFTTTRGVATSAVVPWRYPMAGLATWNRELDLASAQALRELDPARLASGHGPVIQAPGHAMDRAIAGAARRLERSPKP